MASKRTNVSSATTGCALSWPKELKSTIEVFKAGNAAGFSKDQIRRAKYRIGAVANREGFAGRPMDLGLERHTGEPGAMCWCITLNDPPPAV